MLLDRVDITAACAKCARDRRRQHLVKQKPQRNAKRGSAPDGGLTSEPSSVRLLALTPVYFNPKVDFVTVCAVVGDRRLNDPEGDFEVVRSGGYISVVVQDDGNDFPDVH